MEGVGVFKSKVNGVYNGEWLKSKMHGHGISQDNFGNIYDG